MKYAISILIALLIGFVVGYLVEQKLHKNTAQIQIEAVGKAYLNPSKGDTITWVDQQNQRQTVQFGPFGSPCKQGTQVSECTIDVNSGFYKYGCNNCLDPGVGVGSNTQGLGNGGDVIKRGPGPTPPTIVNHANPPDPFVYCDSNTATAQPVTATPSGSDQIQWFPAAAITTADWKIQTPPGMCKEGQTFTPPSRTQPTSTCTIVTNTATTYQVQANACSTSNGQAQLTIH